MCFCLFIRSKGQVSKTPDNKEDLDLHQTVCGGACNWSSKPARATCSRKAAWVTSIICNDIDLLLHNTYWNTMCHVIVMIYCKLYWCWSWVHACLPKIVLVLEDSSSNHIFHEFLGSYYVAFAMLFVVIYCFFKLYMHYDHVSKTVTMQIPYIWIMIMALWFVYWYLTLLHSVTAF